MALTSSDQPLPPELQQALRSIQLVVLALVAGVVVFGGLAVFLSFTIVANPNLQPLNYLSVSSAVWAILLRRVVHRIIIRTECEKIMRLYPETAGDAIDVALAHLFVRGVIVGTALLEGSVMFNFVTYILTHNLLPLIVGWVVAAGMAMQFPTRYRFAAWLIWQRVMLTQRRSSVK